MKDFIVWCVAAVVIGGGWLFSSKFLLCVGCGIAVLCALEWVIAEGVERGIRASRERQ